MSRIKRYPKNQLGRDYIVGDIHGTFSHVGAALRQIGFDTKKDRLFSLGDIIDRGPESHKALAFLSQPWISALQGNHEAMIVDLYADGQPHEAAVQYVTSHNGMGWWRGLPEADRQAMVAAFRKLPIAIEIETPRGTVGLVHGEVPRGMDWRTFTSAIEQGHKEVTQQALWGRSRIGRGDDRGVPGIGRVYCGHTPVDAPTRLGNVYYVDTGAVFGILNEDHLTGRLTMADIACGTATFQMKPGDGFVDIRADAEPLKTPFGTYAPIR